MKSDMSDELVKSMIDAERAALLKLVRKDLSAISKETADKFEAGISKYSELALPVIPKKPKKKPNKLKGKPKKPKRTLILEQLLRCLSEMFVRSFEDFMQCTHF